jgi:hypothetical protein
MPTTKLREEAPLECPFSWKVQHKPKPKEFKPMFTYTPIVSNSTTRFHNLIFLLGEI